MIRHRLSGAGSPESVCISRFVAIQAGLFVALVTSIAIASVCAIYARVQRKGGPVRLLAATLSMANWTATRLVVQEEVPVMYRFARFPAGGEVGESCDPESSVASRIRPLPNSSLTSSSC